MKFKIFFPLGVIVIYITVMVFSYTISNLPETPELAYAAFIEFFFESEEETSDCIGDDKQGSRDCISKIRENFKNSNKIIIAEQYEGDGIFQVQFIAVPGTYNAYIRTDCNCEIADIKVRPL